MISLKCDLCSKELTSLTEYDKKTDKEISSIYPVMPQFNPGPIADLCLNCAKKLDQKIQTLNNYYGKELAKDAREWLLEQTNG
jgi:hypothetical protein